MTLRISGANWQDARILWDYHRMDHELRPCPAGIALGSNDLGVATHAARLYHQGFFPVLVLTQHLPGSVLAAYQRLVRAGFTSRLLPGRSP